MGDCSKYTVGWICAITTEYVAARAFLDREHESLDYGSASDNNIYTLGEMGKHNVAIAQLPKGEYGIAAAASTARDMVRTFPNIRIGLMVGIGGGAPSTKHDIRLGDVVVSAPQNGKGGLFQYDFGKAIQDQEFRTTGFLDQPPGLLRAAMGDIEAEYEMKGHQLDKIVNSVLKDWPKLRKKYKRPDSSSDRLYQSHVVHPPNDGSSCGTVCGDDESKLIVRFDRSDEEDNPAVHYGLIASANQLMKDALIRDKLSAEKDVLCFEMEAAGLMNHFPCLVIRGICDYSDSHKNKEWQGYAAMTAAAYAKELLSRIPPNKVEAEKRISDVLSLAEKNIINEVHKTAQKTITTIEILESGRRREKVMAKLPYAKGSTFHSFNGSLDQKCHPETRIDLRRQIRAWAENGQGKSIFWLKGMAGTGKSTISRTVAESLHMEGKLGASFFFERGEADRSSVAMLFTTICSQLLARIPSLIAPVEAAIDADPNLSDKSMGEQFEKLIYLPLSQIRHHLLQTPKLIIVIDALDECAHDGDTLLHLLSQTRNRWSPSLQIFITSRPEQQIRFGFADVPEEVRESIELHEIPQPIIKQDITTFLKHRFAQIQENYMKDGRSLPSDWPGQEAISTLVEMAVPLFIFAATLCRFVEDRPWSDPTGQLKKMLEYRSMKGGSEIMNKLDATYSPILNQLIYGKSKSEQISLIERFRMIVGTIIHLAEPLSRSSLSSLLNINREQIEGQLSSLYSVLSVPSSADSPIRMFHLSFREFLVYSDKGHTNPFWIDEREMHKMIMAKCLERMSRRGSLQENICHLPSYGILRAEIDSKIIIKYLPTDMQYACRFWVHHLRESQVRINDSDLIYKFLQNHFLHWLESLSLLGSIAEGRNLIQTLQTASDKDTETYRFLDDAMRFIRKNSSMIDQAPLQLYISALIFAPKSSIIKNTFIDSITHQFQIITELDSTWSSLLQTLEGHSKSVTTVAFSPDGKLFATGSTDNTVKLWDPATGTLHQTLEGHSNSVNIVAFSPDGKLVASGSKDKTVNLWDPTTGALQQALKAHSSSILTVAFSPDSKLLAIGSDDDTVKLWDPATGILHQTLEGHSNSVNIVAFSPDGKLVASGSKDKTVNLWDLTTGALQQALKAHSSSILTVAFSPDSKLLAIGSNDDTVELWDPATGTRQRTLDSEIATGTVAFSLDGKMFATGSTISTFELFDLTTGTLLQTLQGRLGSANAVAFSPDSKLLAIGSNDKTVRLWDLPIHTPEQTSQSHSDTVWSVLFSPNGIIVASTSCDNTVKLWDPATGALQHTLQGHLGQIFMVAFSPNSELLATGSQDRTVKLWDLSNGKVRHNLQGHSSTVWLVLFSRDGKLVVTTCYDYYDCTVKFWDSSTGTLLHTLLRCSDPFSSILTFSPDGQVHDSDQGIFSFGSPHVQGLILDQGSIRNNLRDNTLVKDEWLVRNDINVIWLPDEYRASSSAVYQSMFVMGHDSGRVTFLEL